MEDIEYSDLTRALEGTTGMPQAQTPALDTKDPIQGTIAGMPSVVRRTMDFLGFRRSQEVAAADAMVCSCPSVCHESTLAGGLAAYHRHTCYTSICFEGDRPCRLVTLWQVCHVHYFARSLSPCHIQMDTALQLVKEPGNPA